MLKRIKYWNRIFKAYVLGYTSQLSFWHDEPKINSGIKKNEIVIGSFQKDGQGWAEGYIPKLIKGPDLFVKSVEIISKEVPIVVLLTGPARGYVKKELSKRKIKFI